MTATADGPAADGPAEANRPGAPRTLADKVWDAHLVRRGGPGEPDLLYVDRHIMHEV
ncbi:MAG: 3-isopropylmalate dehydratase large subunit, partial [Pseudoclavibacter sp.]|nr:3-isopropylmalate dehydratase large subunit [Pseudoclavibacter sp.]